MPRNSTGVKFPFSKKELECLSPRDQDVLERLFGLKSVQYTMDEVALKWNITAKRVRELRDRALFRLAEQRYENRFKHMMVTVKDLRPELPYD